MYRPEFNLTPEGKKMQGNPPGDGRQHAAEPRVHGGEEIRHPAGGKSAKRPSFGLSCHPQR